MAASAVLLLFMRSGLSMPAMSTLLHAAAGLLVAGMLCYCALTRRLRPGMLFLALAFGIGLVAEVLGTRWGLVFGPYHYNEGLAPGVFGGVPLFIPMTWTLLAYPAVLILRDMRVRVDGQLSLGRLAAKSALCAVFLTGLDFLLDPLATDFGMWTWHVDGAYYGVPLRNFAGWFAVGLAIYGSFFFLKGPRTGEPVRRHALLDVCLYAFCVLLLGIACHASVRGTQRVLPVLIFSVTSLPFLVYGIVSEGRIILRGLRRRVPRRQLV